MNNQKTCSSCQQIKSTSLFRGNKCKNCISEYNKNHYKNNKSKIFQQKNNYKKENPDKIKAIKKKYREKNQEKIKLYIDNYRKENQEKLKTQAKNYYINNKDKIINYHKSYYTNNKLDILKKKRIYRKINKNKIKAYTAENSEKIRSYQVKNYQKIKLYKIRFIKNNPDKIKKYRKTELEKRKTNPIKKIRSNVSRQISRCITAAGNSKMSQSIFKFLPYTFEEFKNYIELLFEPWMSWNNYGQYILSEWDDNDPTTWKWNLDHIIPHSEFNYDSMQHLNFQKCWALSNLRPLQAKINVIEGSKRTRHKK